VLYDGQRKMRTLLAYLIAPLVAAVVATFWFGPSWDLLLVSCIVSYPISWVVGTCAVLILKKQKKEEKKCYTIAGAVSGALIPFAFPIGHWPGIEILIVSVMYAFFGAIVAFTFAFIRGPQRVHPDGVVNASASRD
jgi:O-antigen/teichoic acid export membrane protein